MMNRPTARTPLMSALRRAMALAAVAQPGERCTGSLTRRGLLRGSVVGGLAGLAGVGSMAGCTAPAPKVLESFLPHDRVRVAIVGGGLAGLTAAYTLKQFGVTATVYEAGRRLGGRVYTVTDLLGPGVVTELGGEFIDSDHADLLTLATELGLVAADRAPGEPTLSETYCFGGTRYTTDDVVAALRPLVDQVQGDAALLGERLDFEHVTDSAVVLDRMTLGEYLQRLGATGWIKDLITVACVTEFGLGADQQSSLNFVQTLGTDLSQGVHLDGPGDRRFTIVGGNGRLIGELARRVGDAQVRSETRLVKLSYNGDRYHLVFSQLGGRTHEVEAEVVALALPFTMLREVELALALPTWKTRAIEELGYGTAAKLMIGIDRAKFDSRGYSGRVFSDQAFQVAWDSTRNQPGPTGGVTMLLGGHAGVDAGLGTAASQVQRLLRGLDDAMPGVGAAFNGQAARFHWPSAPLVRGSYACYRPGQWTTIAGAEYRPIGNLYFIGEHASVRWRGTMNGAVATARHAARTVLESMGKKV